MRTGDKDYILLDCKCGKKLKTESCNIGLRILCPECNNKILVPDEFTTYYIKFGSAFSKDKFGFVGIGKMDNGMKTVQLSGKRKWSALARIGIFLAISILPAVLFGFGLGIIPALLVVGYFCVSPGSVSFEKSQVANLKRSGRKIMFMAPDWSRGEYGKMKKSLFKAQSEDEATAIEAALKN